jgi:endonuclease YncB( thermonuclease family)
VSVEVTDIDRYDRLVGKIWLGDRDINRELVREGNARVYRQYLEDRSLLKDEAYAKDSELGLWSLSNPVAPWE